MQPTDKRDLNVKHSAGCVSQLPLETETSLENCEVKSEPWHYHCSEGKPFLGLFFLSSTLCMHAAYVSSGAAKLKTAAPGGNTTYSKK